MCQEQLSPLIAFIFYPPYLSFFFFFFLIGMYEGHLRLSGRPKCVLKLFSHFSTFDFKDRTHPFDTDIQ